VFVTFLTLVDVPYFN